MPSAHFLMPFSGDNSLLRLPPFPASFSFKSLGGFLLNIFKAPPLSIYAYVHLKAAIESRLYRLIRRHLPKPDFADECSIKVAYDNNLVDWMIPTLGHRADEENARRHLTLFQDIKWEISGFKHWIMSCLGFYGGRDLDRLRECGVGKGRLESLQRDIAELQRELVAAAEAEAQMSSRRPVSQGADEEDDVRDSRGSGTESLRRQITALQSELDAQLSPQQPSTQRIQRAEEQTEYSGAQGARIDDNNVPPPSSSLQRVPLSDVQQAFTNEESGISQSSLQMDNEYLTHVTPRTELLSRPTHDVHPAPARMDGDGLDSRASTLSPPLNSPGTSPPTSPRVHASLIHQSSDIITMQLELLTNGNPRSPSQPASREFTEDTSTVNPEGQETGVSHSSEARGNSLSTRGTAATGEGGDTEQWNASNTVLESLDENIRTTEDGPSGEQHTHRQFQTSDSSGFEESQSDATETRPRTSRSTVRPRPLARILPVANRLTILSAQPVDSVASHMASLLSTILLVPLESFYLRSLASSYLSSQGMSVQDIRPLGAWVGGGSMKDSLAYAGKVAALVGLQAMGTTCIWGYITRAVIYIGRTFCAWGAM